MFERGEFVGYRGLAWDVTERESLISRISDSEARFRALTELSSDWYWEMDENLRFTLLRQGARGSFGLDDEEVIGKHRWELPGELIQPSSWDEHRATLLGRRPFRDVMFRRWMPDGSLVYHLTSGDPGVRRRRQLSRLSRHRQEHHATRSARRSASSGSRRSTR